MTRKRNGHKELSPLLPLDPLQRYTVDEACRYLRISRTHMYKEISSRRLRTISDGRRTFIPGLEIVARSRAPEETE